MIEKFRLLKGAATNSEAVAGTAVYSCKYHDYGLASDDTAATGIPHISVTLSPEGEYPCFTVPERDLEAVEAGLMGERMLIAATAIFAVGCILTIAWAIGDWPVALLIDP